MELSAKAKQNIEAAASYDVAAIERAWAQGDYGWLVNAHTGQDIRPATQAEALESYEAGPEGYIECRLTTIHSYIVWVRP